MYLGDFRLESTLDHKFSSVSTAGVPTILAGSPVISAYVGNSTTQLTAGITLSVDFDSVTGLNNVRVVATAANGYATASNYQLVITTGTVGGASVVGYVVGSFSIENRSALMPTVHRTLDVSVGGEAGIDWANVGSPTTTLGLSGTTVKTATDVETDTQDIQARLPAALVSGRIDSSVGAMASGVLTAASIATDAITAAKIADGAIDAATFAAGAINAAAIAADAITDAKVASDVTIASVTGAVGSVTGAVGSIATGGIAATSFAAGAIDAAAIAADAIGSSELAASAVTEIQSGLATSSALSTLQTSVDDLPTNAELATSQAAADDATLAAIAALNNLSAAQVNTEVDAALVDVRLDELLSADSDIDGAAPPAVGSVFHELMTKTAGSFTYDQTTDALEALRDRGDAAWTDSGTPPSAATVASAVRTELTTELGRVDATMSSRATPAQVNAEADTALSDVGLTTTITGRIDAAVSSRLASAGYTVPPTATENADALLARDIGSGTGAGSLNERTVRSAMRFNRNKFAISGGILTVYEEDDITVAWTATITQTAGNPVSASDPV